jgi:hypothetical protein
MMRYTVAPVSAGILVLMVIEQGKGDAIFANRTVLKLQSLGATPNLASVELCSYASRGLVLQSR